MCIACTTVGLPVCVATGTCVPYIHQLFQLGLLSAGPIAGVVIMSLKSPLTKHQDHHETD